MDRGDDRYPSRETSQHLLEGLCIKVRSHFSTLLGRRGCRTVIHSYQPSICLVTVVVNANAGRCPHNYQTRDTNRTNPSRDGSDWTRPVIRVSKRLGSARGGGSGGGVGRGC